jgi:hypothetical protein
MAGHYCVAMTSLELSDIREALEEAIVDESRLIVDPLSESKITRPVAEPDRQWIPVDVVRRVIDELATATVARASDARMALRSPSRANPRTSEPDALRQVLDLVETLPTEHRTAAVFRDDLLATLKRWRVRARDGKPHWWTDRGD